MSAGPHFVVRGLAVCSCPVRATAIGSFSRAPDASCMRTWLSTPHTWCTRTRCPLGTSYTAFLQMLHDGQINRPDSAVLSLIRQTEAVRMNACHEIDDALTLYREVKARPKTNTRAVITAGANVYINGPAFGDKFPHLLSGMRAGSLQPVLIKVHDHGCLQLFTHSPTCNHNLTTRSQLLRADPSLFGPGVPSMPDQLVQIDIEVKMCEVLRLTDAHDTVIARGLVPTLPQKIEVPPHVAGRGVDVAGPPGPLFVLVMPWLCCTLANSPVVPLTELQHGFRRLISAIDSIHAAGYVHCDIKASNIFVAVDGSWCLGDYGSCRPVGARVVTTTVAFSPMLVGATGAIPPPFRCKYCRKACLVTRVSPDFGPPLCYSDPSFGLVDVASPHRCSTQSNNCR